MHHVGQHLIVGIRMNGGHQTVDNTDLVVQRLDQWSQAVGGARCIRDHGVGRLQHILVDAEYDGRVDILAARCGDDHLLGAALDVRGRFFLGGEEAGAFEHDVDLQFAPWDLRRITLCEHLDLVAIDDHEFAIDFDRARELAVRGVVAGQVRVRLRIAEIVDGNDLDVIFLAAFVVSAQDVTADAAIAVDCNTDSHGFLLETKIRRFQTHIQNLFVAGLRQRVQVTPAVTGLHQIEFIPFECLLDQQFGTEPLVKLPCRLVLRKHPHQ